MSGLLENGRTNISMHHCSPIQGKRSLFFLKVGDRFVPYFFFFLRPSTVDWRTLMHWNVTPTIFQKPWHMWLSWKIIRTTFQCMVVFQSRGKDSNSCWNFMKPGSQSGTYQSVLIKKIKKISSWGLLLCFNLHTFHSEIPAS